jgi:hypothetical protein
MAKEPMTVHIGRRLVRLRALLFFLLGMAAVDWALGAFSGLWSAYDPQAYQARLTGCQATAHDLVIIGGSPTMAGVDPTALTGLTWQGRPIESAFNASLPLGTTTEVWHLVEHGLPTPPRLLVYGITASDLNDNRVTPEGPCYLMDAGDVAEWVRERPQSATWCLRHYAGERVSRLWSLYYYRDGIRCWAAERAEGLRPGLCPEAAAEARLRRADGERMYRGELITCLVGPATRLDCLKAAGRVYDLFPYLERFQLGQHLACLHRLLDWAEARGVPVVLFDVPVSADLEERLWPGPFARYREALAEVERSRGVTVLRPTRAAVGIDDADFSDWVHLNATGAERLSRWLRDALETLDASPGRQSAE